MHGRVARHAFEALGCLDHLVDALVLGHGGPELGFLLDGLVQRDLEHVRHQLGEPVDLPERQVHHPAHVLDGGLGRHGVEGDDLRDLLATVLLGDVLDHLPAPIHAEIDVHVRHRLALDVQEALEEQSVLQGVDVGDRHRIGDQRACRGPAAGPDRDLPLAGDPDEIPDDQEVPGVLHLLDDLDLVVKPLRVLLQRPAQQTLGVQGLEARSAHLEALPGHVFEVGVDRVLGGHVELGERIRDRLEREVAHLGDFPRAIQRALVAIEQRRHLLAALEIELLGLEPHAVLVAERLPGLDAKQGLVGARVFPRQVVRVIRRHQRYARLARQAQLQRDQFLVKLEAVVLYLEEEVLLAEDVLVLVGQPAALLVALLQQRLLQVAPQAGRQANQALRIAREQVLADPRLVVEAFGICGGDQVDQIAIAGLVLAQQQQVVVAHACVVLPVVAGDRVDLAADDRLDAGLLGRRVEIDGAEEVAVVRDRHGRPLPSGGHFHQPRNVAGPVEKGVIRMAVQVDERLCHRESDSQV